MSFSVFSITSNVSGAGERAYDFILHYDNCVRAEEEEDERELGGGRSADACVDVKELFRLEQCDQIARLLFNVWPFTSMKTCPMACKFCQSRSPIFSQIGNKPTKKLPKTLKTLPKWQNFAESGHTGFEQQRSDNEERG